MQQHMDARAPHTRKHTHTHTDTRTHTQTHTNTHTYIHTPHTQEMTRDYYNKNMGGKTKLAALEQVSYYRRVYPAKKCYIRGRGSCVYTYGRTLRSVHFSEEKNSCSGRVPPAKMIKDMTHPCVCVCACVHVCMCVRASLCVYT